MSSLSETCDQQVDSSELATTDSQKFYKDAETYWSSIPATVDGMLGGFACISPIDIQGSERFLTSLFKSAGGPDNSSALDCGAGIGRITRNLLQKHFLKVDLVEQNHSFLLEARNYLGNCKRVRDYVCCGLQDFTPPANCYDVIWCQWVLGHLQDDDLVAFFNRCKTGLKPRGVMVVKENIAKTEVEVDHTDSSVTRPITVLKELFVKSRLKIIRQQKQQRFPQELYAVQMFALRPDS